MGNEGHEYSFGELWDKAITYLQNGVQKDEIYAVNGRNLHEWLITSFGIQMAGRYVPSMLTVSNEYNRFYKVVFQHLKYKNALIQDITWAILS